VPDGKHGGSTGLKKADCRTQAVHISHRMPRRKPPTVPDELLDRLLAGSDPRAALADGGLLDGLKKALAERALNAELDHHLEGGEPDGRANARNGYGAKTVLTGTGRLDPQVPRDRLASFDPQPIAKDQRRFPGVDDKVVSMYARGMSTREIQGHLRELYGIEVSPDLVSAVTDAVLDEVAEWQNRPLEALYPLVFLDAIRVKVRDEGTVRDKAVHVALGVRPDGAKEVLGLWIEQTEDAKFWLRVVNELRDRGVEDILIAVVDGLKGFPEAIAAVFPRTQVQACIGHLIRSSLDFVSYEDRKAVAAALKDIYRARDAEAGRAALDDFADGPWGRRYPAIAQSWRRHWMEVIPFCAFPAEVRRIVYTTNAIEALHAKLRRAVRARGHFPTDEAVLKLLFLVLNLAAEERRMPAREWSAAKAQFAILFEDRFTTL
jgi:putative transposase